MLQFLSLVLALLLACKSIHSNHMVNQYGWSHPLLTCAAISNLYEEFYGEHLFSNLATVHPGRGWPEYCLNEALMRIEKIMLFKVIKYQVLAYVSISRLATLSLFYSLPWPTYICSLFSRPSDLSLCPSHVTLHQSISFPFPWCGVVAAIGDHVSHPHLHLSMIMWLDTLMESELDVMF